MKRKLFKDRHSAIAVAVILGLTSIYHILVLLRVVPFEIVWGGRLESVEQMYLMESISLVINVVIIILALARGNIIKSKRQKILRFIMWFLTGLFVLNTIGNLNAISEIETAIFTPITFILAILCYQLALKNEPIKKSN